MEIRYAQDKDYPFILFMATSFIEESGYPFPISTTKMRDVINSFIQAHGHGKACIVMVDSHDHPVGMVAGAVTDLYYTDERVAQEIVWYVDIDYRGIRESIELLKAFEAWAKWQKCKYVQVSNLQEVNGDKVEKFYNKFGYSKKESAFLKEFN